MGDRYGLAVGGYALTFVLSLACGEPAMSGEAPVEGNAPASAPRSMASESTAVGPRPDATRGPVRPTFEARVGGPYQWLNESRFRSADPGIGLGTVTIVVLESNQRLAGLCPSP